jgi:DNA-binding CsgD family transcriptional regulator
LAMLQEIVDTAQTSRSSTISELANVHVNAMNFHYWMDKIEAAQREQQAALALAQNIADDALIGELASLDALFTMARAWGKSSKNEESWPLGTVSTIPQLNRLYLHKLVRQGQVERVWHFAAAFGVQIHSKITTENLLYIIFLFKAAIARGTDIEAIPPRIAAAITQAERMNSRLFATELYTLLAWCHLQQGRRAKAERALVCALDLAIETGYVRFILDIPALAPLLAVIDHPAAAKMWVATVPEEVRQQAAQLTDQERLVLVQLMGPNRYQDIADNLGISINTVRTHIRHIYRKLAVTNRKDVVARARALGLAVKDDLLPNVNSS